jgi:hypothetical protein
MVLLHRKQGTTTDIDAEGIVSEKALISAGAVILSGYTAYDGKWPVWSCIYTQKSGTIRRNTMAVAMAM